MKTYDGTLLTLDQLLIAIRKAKKAGAKGTSKIILVGPDVDDYVLRVKYTRSGIYLYLRQ